MTKDLISNLIAVNLHYMIDCRVLKLQCEKKEF